MTALRGTLYNAGQTPPNQPQCGPAAGPPAHGGRSGPAESEAVVPVQMELKRIIISEVHDQQVIMLKEVEGDRSFPIVIGIFEATSIDRRVKKCRRHDRSPMT